MLKHCPLFFLNIRILLVVSQIVTCLSACWVVIGRRGDGCMFDVQFVDSDCLHFIFPPYLSSSKAISLSLVNCLLPFSVCLSLFSTCLFVSLYWSSLSQVRGQPSSHSAASSSALQVFRDEMRWRNTVSGCMGWSRLKTHKHT